MRAGALIVREVSSARSRRLRRLIDVVGVVLALPLVLPLVALAALAIRVETPGPVVVRIPRIGERGRRLTVYKLRTMVRNADDLKEELRALNVMRWPDFKIPDDPRVTRVGRVLRRTSVDELPQLWNVLCGEMTLVGPRPCSVSVRDYALWQTERLEAVPGLFGRWQFAGRGVVDFAERCRMDISQVRRPSFGSEFVLAARTIFAVLACRGAS